MHSSLALLLELGIVLVVLSVLGSAARRLTVPAIPLYLIAGLALGDGGLAAVPAASDFVRTGAAIGVVLLLLVLGLEFSIDEFMVSARRHVPSAALDLVVNAAPGAVAGILIGLDAAGGWYAAGCGLRGRLRAGTALIAWGEFSIVIVSVVGMYDQALGDMVVACVLLLAVVGPLCAWYLPSLAIRRNYSAVVTDRP